MNRKKIEFLVGLTLVFGLLFSLSNCVKESKNIEDWTVQKRLDRGETIREILVSHQPHDIIGNTAEGGIIIYLSLADSKGISFYPEAVANDIKFGCTINEVETGRDIFTGQQNTIDLIEMCDTVAIAPYMCDTLQVNGYSDWFLPSVDELELIMKVMNDENFLIGSFYENYWSSTTYNSEVLYWAPELYSAGYQEKDTTASIFAVRMFSF
jgi:hypothetical protein